MKKSKFDLSRFSTVLLMAIELLFCFSVSFSLADSPSSKALEDVASLAESLDPDQQYELALKFTSGNGVRVDFVRSFELMALAANQGHIKAQYNLGKKYEYGVGVMKSRDTAIEWYQVACDNNYSNGCLGVKRLSSN